MDFPGEPWVRTREGRVALPKGREGDMLHSQLVKLGQLQGRKEVRANQSNWIISEELTATKQSRSEVHKHHRRVSVKRLVSFREHAGFSWQSSENTVTSPATKATTDHKLFKSFDFIFKINACFAATVKS